MYSCDDDSPALLQVTTSWNSISPMRLPLLDQYFPCTCAFKSSCLPQIIYSQKQISSSMYHPNMLLQAPRHIRAQASVGHSS